MVDYYDGIRILKDKRNGVPLGIEWRFADGTKFMYYPKDSDSEWFSALTDDVRLEQNLAKRERYHTEYSIDDCVFEGSLFADNDTPAYLLNLKEEEQLIASFMSTLTDVQRRRLQMKIDNPGLSLRKLSASENVSKNAFAKTFNQIKSKYTSFIAAL